MHFISSQLSSLEITFLDESSLTALQSLTEIIALAEPALKTLEVDFALPSVSNAISLDLISRELGKLFSEFPLLNELRTDNGILSRVLSIYPTIKFPELRRIHTNGSVRWSNSMGYNPQYTLDIDSVGKSFPTLRNIESNRFILWASLLPTTIGQNLETIMFSKSIQWPFQYYTRAVVELFATIGASCPRLRSLRFRKVHILDGHDSAHLNGAIRALFHCRFIEELELSTNIDLSFFLSISDVADMSESWPSLTILTIRGTPPKAFASSQPPVSLWAVINGILHRCSRISSITLSMNMVELVPRFSGTHPILRHLDLGNSHISDSRQTAKALRTICPASNIRWNHRKDSLHIMQLFRDMKIILDALQDVDVTDRPVQPPYKERGSLAQKHDDRAKEKYEGAIRKYEEAVKQKDEVVHQMQKEKEILLKQNLSLRANVERLLRENSFLRGEKLESGQTSEDVDMAV
jgi:hypothetical protein